MKIIRQNFNFKWVICMAREDENIYKRKDDRYEGSYIKDYGIKGKEIIGYIYEKTYKEAKEKITVCKIKG